MLTFTVLDFCAMVLLANIYGSIVSFLVLDFIQLRNNPTRTENRIDFELTFPLSCYYEATVYCQDYPNMKIKTSVLDPFSGKGYCEQLRAGNNYSIIALTTLVNEEEVYEDKKTLASLFTGR